MADTHKHLTNALKDKVICEMENDLGELEDSEQRERLWESLDRLMKLFNSGVAICKAIDTPSTASILFPPIEAQQVSGKELKMLADKTPPKNAE